MDTAEPGKSTPTSPPNTSLPEKQETPATTLDKSLPVDHNDLAQRVIAEYAALPEEQKRRFDYQPEQLSNESPNPSEAAADLFEKAERTYEDFRSVYKLRQNTAGVGSTVAPPLHELIDLTHYVLQFPSKSFTYGTFLAQAFKLAAGHWYSISFVRLQWGKQIHQLYALAINPFFPRLRMGFSTSAYYHEFYRAWRENSTRFQDVVLPALSPRPRFLVSNIRREEYEEIMMSFARAEPHLAWADRMADSLQL